MKLKAFCVGLFLGFLALCTGCESLQQAGVVKKPSVSVAGFSFESITATDVGLVIDLEVRNPNPFAVNLSSYDYAVSLAGEPLVSAKKANPLRIASHEQSRVSIPMTVPYSALNAISKSVGDKQSVVLGLDATAWLDLPVLGRTAFPTSQQIEMPVPRMPTITVDGFSVRRMGLTSADVDVRVQIENPNRFMLMVSDFVGGLTVNGQKWVETRKAEPIRLAPGKAQSFVVPVSISTLALGSSALQMLQGGQALSYGLEGKMVLGSDIPALKHLSLPFAVTGKLGAN